MIYTSYFANMKNINGLKTVSIARNTPIGVKVDAELKALAPSAELLQNYKNGSINEAEYRYKFEEQLAELDPYDFEETLDNSVLLCFEKEGDFCHRHLVAEWFKAHGIEISEIGKGALPNKETNKSRNFQVEFEEELNTKICEENGNKIFVFGDNLLKKGMAGQAVIRNMPNAYGIPTKRAPSMHQNSFFSDKADEMDSVVSALRKLYVIAQKTGRTVVFPYNGLGTGLAEMDVHSPKIFEKMNTIIKEFFIK